MTILQGLGFTSTILLYWMWPSQQVHKNLYAPQGVKIVDTATEFPETQTHVIDYHKLYRAQSVKDGRLALLDSTTHIRVVGEVGGRHIILWDHNETYNLIDKYFEGSVVLVATPIQTDATCADVVQVDELVLLKQPIAEEELAVHCDEFVWPTEITALDYLDFGLPSGTECRVVGEQGDFWKINLIRGELSYLGFIPKKKNGRETLLRNCETGEEIEDSRASFEPPTYPDWVEGTYHASSERMSFTLKVFEHEGFLRGNLQFYHPMMGWKEQENIDCFYSPEREAISFPGIMNRCEIRRLEGNQIRAVDGNNRFFGTREE